LSVKVIVDSNAIKMIANGFGLKKELIWMATNRTLTS